MMSLRAFLYREWALYSRSKLDIGMSLMLPLVTVFFFSVNMMGIVGDVQGVPYVQFLLPGIAVMSLISNAIGAATRTFNEGYSFVLTELMSMPASKSDCVTAKIVAATTLAAVQASIFLFGGSIVFNIHVMPSTILGCCVGIGLTALGVVGLFLSIALYIKDMGTFLVVSNVVGQIIIWTSTIFYPSETMPPILEWVSFFNPLSHGTNILRGVLNCTPNTVGSWIYLLVFSSVFGVAAIRLLARRNESLL